MNPACVDKLKRLKSEHKKSEKRLLLLKDITAINLTELNMCIITIYKFVLGVSRDYRAFFILGQYG